MVISLVSISLMLFNLFQRGWCRHLLWVKFIGSDVVAMVLSVNLFVGRGLKRRLKPAMKNENPARELPYLVIAWRIQSVSEVRPMASGLVLN